MLKSWDGKSVEYLKDIYAQGYVDRDDIINSLSTSDLTEKRAGVWLIKHMLEAGEKLTFSETKKLLQTFKVNDYWDIRLNILQSFKYLSLDDQLLLEIEKEIIECNGSDNKFLRAWSYEGLYYLSKVSEPLEMLFNEKVNEGFQRETGAVLSRIRQIIKKRDQDAKRASLK